MRAKSKIRHLVSPAFCSSITISGFLLLLICSVRHLGYLQSSELAVFDLMMRWSRDRQETLPKASPRITLVEITEADIKTWKQSIFSDRLIAKLIAELQKNEPKVIGLDIYRDVPQPPGNRELARQLEADNIVVINNLSPKGIVPAPPNVPPSRVGFNNLMLDLDGKVRRNFISAPLGDRQVYSLGFQLAKSYLDLEEADLSIAQNYLKLKQTIFSSIEADMGGYQLAASDVFGVQFLLKYQPFNRIARRLSITEILRGEYPSDWIDNKIVAIGYTAPSKKDIFATPYSTAERMPGVEIHVQMVAQILGTVLDGQLLFRSLPEWGEIIWIWAWSWAGAVLGWRIRHPVRLGVSLLLMTSGLLVICLGGFVAALWLPLVPTLIVAIGTAGGTLGYRTLRESVVDELTGLANSKQIARQLKKAIARPLKNQIAVLTIEIERFKTIDESLGREMSNYIIVLVAKRIQNCIRTDDRLAKVKTAQFILLLSSSSQQQILNIVTRIQQELAQTFQINDREVAIASNVGVAFHDPSAVVSVPELLRNSRIAKDRARTMGKNMSAVFTPRMHLETVAQWELENDLRQGIINEEFELYYQPIIDLNTKRLAGFEALIRWISPTRGFVSPGEFIPLAEATELIVPLGNWILDSACRQMQEWEQQFAIQDSLTMSINLSSHQFSADLVVKVKEVLEETQLKPQCLKLEITESAMMVDVGETIALLNELKALKVKLSIDDFGTGYSSLSYLQQFGADTLKIDRSFVEQMELSAKDLAIVEIIVHLAHKLEMNIIAEGIETTTQEQILQTLNCEYGQGYLFAKPLEREAATKLIFEAFAAKK